MPGVDRYTFSMLHFDGTDGSSIVVDSNSLAGSSHVWTTSGSAQLDTAIKKFGTAALLCSSGGSASTPSNADFNYGTSNITIDFWINCQGNSSELLYIMGQNDAATTVATRTIGCGRTSSSGAGNTVFFETVTSSGLSVFTFGTTAITSVSSWKHFALVRRQNLLTIYVNGTAEGTSSFPYTVQTSSYPLNVGRFGEFNTNTFVGSIDEFRITIGSARWSANFTPPAQPYDTATGTHQVPDEYRVLKKKVEMVGY